jgi:hypothetical protein
MTSSFPALQGKTCSKASVGDNRTNPTCEAVLGNQRYRGTTVSTVNVPHLINLDWRIENETD